MASENPAIIIDIGDPERDGVYQNFDTQTKGKFGIDARSYTHPCKFRLVRQSKTTDRPWDDVNVSGALIEFGAGLADRPPTAGTFGLSYNGSSTGLTALAYNITAAALQTALNGNAAITTAGGVTVQKISDICFQVTFVVAGNRFTIGSDVGSLFPQSAISVTVEREGTVSVAEVQLIVITQNPYCYTQDFTAEISGAASVISRQNGANNPPKKSIQRVQFAEGVEPYNGNLIYNFAAPQVTTIGMRANSDSAQRTVVTFQNADVAGDYASTSIWMYKANGDPVVAWFKVSGTGTAPPTPTGGTMVEIDITTGADIYTIAAAFQTGVDAASGLTATLTASFVAVVTDTSGIVADSFQIGLTGKVNIQNFPGSDGDLDQKVWIGQDSLGSVGVWLNATGALVAPQAALDCARQVEVDISAATTVGDVVDAHVTAFTGDTGLIVESNVSGTGVIVTDIVGGPRTDTADSVTAPTGFIFATTRTGQNLTNNVPYDASQGDLQDAFAQYFRVVYRADGNIDFTAIAPGPLPLMTIDDSDLSYPNTVFAQLSLNTTPLFQAFSTVSATRDYIDLTAEGRITFPGKEPYLFLRIPFRIYRSVLDSGSYAPTPTPISFIVDPPAAMDSPGIKGQLAFTDQGLYECYATGTGSGTNRWLFLPGIEFPVT
jgi:hypothetical protein